MSKIYNSIPHTIEAFRFTNKPRDLPEWFLDAVIKGKASVTRSKDEVCINIYGKNQTEKAFLDDFVCLSPWGKIYVLDDKTFCEGYKEKMINKTFDK